MYVGGYIIAKCGAGQSVLLNGKVCRTDGFLAGLGPSVPRCSHTLPIYLSNITNKVSWSIVSNAADKSSRTRCDLFPFPTMVKISL